MGSDPVKGFWLTLLTFLL